VLHHSTYTRPHVNASCFLKQTYEIKQDNLGGRDYGSKYLRNGPHGKFAQSIATVTDTDTERSNMGEEASLCDTVQHGNMDRLSKPKLVRRCSVMSPPCLNSTQVSTVSNI
jgi:hypothetical protein